MEERKLLMRLPAGRRYIIEYDKTGASLYSIVTPSGWDGDRFAAAANVAVPSKAEMDVIWKRKPPPEPKRPSFSELLLKRREPEPPSLSPEEERRQRFLELKSKPEDHLTGVERAELLILGRPKAFGQPQ